tara:strand:+ start:56 stop:532 length:477 start_codon:yes stop_codon:yes gene_type:complete
VEEISQYKSGRIDLSRFSGITAGKWEIIDTHGGGIDVGVRTGRYQSQGVGHTPVITFTRSLARVVRNSERDMADLQAIAAIPDLISELNKCYEAIDVLSESTLEITESMTSLATRLEERLEKQNRDIEEIIDCLDGVGSIFGEEVIGMLRPLLESASE